MFLSALRANHSQLTGRKWPSGSKAEKMDEVDNIPDLKPLKCDQVLSEGDKAAGALGLGKAEHALLTCLSAGLSNVAIIHLRAFRSGNC